MARRSSPAAVTAPPAAASRQLVFQDGGSSKFWNIELDGRSHTVTFGRAGTQGQTQTKEFDSDDAARKSFDKLVAEKLKKGYADAAGSAGAAAAPVSQNDGKALVKGKKTRKVSAEESLPAADAGTSGQDAAVDTQVTRRIDLAPSDWLRATFRPRPRQDRGEAAPFDLDRCVSQLAKLKTEMYGWDIRWRDLSLPAALSREEAHFWLEAMTTYRTREEPPKKLAEKLAKEKFDGKLDISAIEKRFRGQVRDLPPEITLVLISLCSIEQLLDLVLAKPASPGKEWNEAHLFAIAVTGFSRYVIPYLSDEEMEAARRRIRKSWDLDQAASTSHGMFPIECYMAAILGMHDEVASLTSQWEDNRYGKNDWKDHFEQPQEIVVGLASAEQVESEWRRLGLRMRNADQARAFLACTEYAALDCVRDSVLAADKKDNCEELLSAFALVHAPEAAEPMLECRLAAKSPAAASEWLEANVGNAVAGLISTAAGRGKLADAAVDYLRGAKRRGHAGVIADCLKKSKDAEAVAKVQRLVIDHEEKEYAPLDDASTPDWLRQALDSIGKIKAVKAPSWAAPSLLPPLVVGDHRLNDQQVAMVLNVLAATPISQRHPLVTALREHVERHARDEFAWRLFQSWLESGSPSKEKWAMGAIGHLGGDGAALRLTPLVRTWPGESQHQRAVFGLECLRAIGSDVALMQLAGVAQKLKFKGLKAKAEQFVNEIAAEKGLTRAELEDRIVPDCGLDENGRREFSFGSRTFSFALGPDLKPMIRDADGKLRGDLPKPGAKDDAALAQQSVADWKLLKKQIREVAQIQASRLEQTMVTGRRLKVADFETLLVRHPLMTHLARQLLWGAFDTSGKRLAAFRVTEERDYADVQDHALSIAEAETVGVLHPLEMSDQERSAWGEVLSDYEIVSPFPQLGRAVYTLEAGEEKKDDLERFQGTKLVAPTLVFTLEKLGWTRGVAMDGGCFDEHSKQFPAANVTAVVEYEGVVGMGYIDPNEMLTLKSCFFVSGMRAPSGYGWGKEKKLKLKDAPPVVLSEVLADLQVLKSKGK